MKKPAGMRPALTALALALALPGASARAGFVEDAQQALAAQQQGRRKEAALLWRKATEQNPDGFIWDLRGWSDLGDGDAEAARQDFLMGIDRATATSTQAEANLGLGLAALALRKPEPGLAALGKALLQTPFVIPAASYETALLALKQGDNLKALAFLRQALSLDPLHLESLRALARLADTLKRKDEAWAAYARLAQLDPGDSRSVDRLKALARSIPGDPSQGLAPRRLSLPLLDASAPAKPPLGPEEPRLRVALFSDGHGAPATLTQISFLTNAPFRLEAGAQTINKETTPGDPWRLVFRPERGVLEVRDGAGNLRLTTQQTVRIIPLVRQGSVLVKNAVFAPGSGFDPGDRELRGSFEAHPTGDGFLAVNEVPLEDYLYSVVGAALPQGSPPEALKAQAVAARTLALWYRQHSSTMAIAQLCDSPACQLYAGVNAEMRHASDAVSSTEGLVLTRAGQPLKALQQEDCGGLTETGPDGPGPAAPTTPLELERFLHAAPAAGRYDMAQSLLPAADARWIRLLCEKPLRRRANQLKRIGKILRLQVARRSPLGRVEALDVVGRRGTLALEGFQEIQEVLSPGSLRSSLFSIVSLRKPAGPVRWLLFGAGSGQGQGFCRAGAIGQAALGRDFRQILSVYFPDASIEKLPVKSR